MKTVPGLSLALLLSGCGQMPVQAPPGKADLGTTWVESSAEYQALSLQAYQEAASDLDRLIRDVNFSALPDQKDAYHLPPAIILDVDETVVSNVEFQLSYVPPFSSYKMDLWGRENAPRPIAGVVDFIALARQKGVEVFFVTNRPCEPEGDDPCPAHETTVVDIAEVGIDTDDEHVLLRLEQPEWTREKKVRRDLIAEEHRVIMLFGDDLGDFIACVRVKNEKPCKGRATEKSRIEDVNRYRRYWGEGWYILPNPMYGSWTSAVE